MLFNNFNANNYQPTTFDPLPAGKYMAIIEDADEQPTKLGDGSYLKLTLSILNPEYENRKLFVRLNLNNPNEIAVAIARGQLADICRAIGVLEPNDSSDLIGYQLVIKVTQKRRQDNDEITNEVKGFFPVDSAASATPAAPAARPAAVQQPIRQQVSAVPPRGKVAPAAAWGKPPKNEQIPF